MGLKKSEFVWECFRNVVEQLFVNCLVMFIKKTGETVRNVLKVNEKFWRNNQVITIYHVKVYLFIYTFICLLA